MLALGAWVGNGGTVIAEDDTVAVPAGVFLMGQTGSDADSYIDEVPVHAVDVPAFSISRLEVTNAQYAEFLNAVGFTADPQNHAYIDAADPQIRIHRTEDGWQADTGWEDHPMREVSWYGADAYCRWKGGRLPTEAEWEKASRWDEAFSYSRKWPWGNSFSCDRVSSWWCNQPYSTGVTTLPVGSLPDGASPYGALDMAGNVWEWTMGGYASYPDGPLQFEDFTREVVRGGSWTNSDYNVRCATRSPLPPFITDANIGFRVCYSPLEPPRPQVLIPTRSMYAEWTEDFLDATPMDQVVYWWGSGYRFQIDPVDGMMMASLRGRSPSGEMMAMIRRDPGGRFAPGDYVDISVRLKYERGDRDYARTSVAVAWGDKRLIEPGGRGADENTGFPWYLIANNSDTPEEWHEVTVERMIWGEGKLCIGFGVWGNLSYAASPPIVDQHRMWVDWVRVRHSPGNWPPGDFDFDQDVDLDDFAFFQACQYGPYLAYPPSCRSADLDHDGDVDLDDFGMLQRCFSGAGQTADPGCAY